jgi:MFS family permease
MASGLAEGSSPLFTRTLVLCVVIGGVIHVTSYLLNALLPLHMVALGGSKTQVGLLFSVATVVSMILRPLVGGWIDRHGIRPVILPGVFGLTLTSLGFHLAGTPGALIALMVGIGLGNGLVVGPCNVLIAQAAAPARRGEALSTYYVATSVGIAIGPPVGLLLYRAGGMRLGFLAVTALALGIASLAMWLVRGAGRPAPGARPPFRLWSRHAVAAAGALVLTSIGHSSIYAFLPLYAISHGMGHHVTWFFVLFSVWLIVCRVLFRRASDRVGRARVIVPATAAIALGFFSLVTPPTVPSLAASALLLATGASVLYPTFVALVVDRTPEAERGLAIGTVSGFFDLGTVVGASLIGLVVEHASFGAGFAVAGVMAALGLLAFVATERRRARRMP